ncbi:FKBP-type peptidyl-prolyl cis-trans isomerase [Microbacterium koreense]|uniref:Peptidyl-prolyl cis-trans isomerase n=1 Tax=Microbacterium koreense TaxID=323761 RepID=A0ABW2ZUL1_9MICO
MRIRPLVALSLSAVALLALAGCSAAEPEATPTADGAGVDLCASAAPDGDVVTAVSVEGAVGETPVVTFVSPLEVAEAERTVVIEGDGASIASGDYVSYALSLYDASTGELLQEGGFDGAALPAMPIEAGTGADIFFGCATEGSRLAVTTPATDTGAAQVYVIDVLEVTPADQWCAVTEPGDDFPTVEFSDDGIPTITIPDAEAPEGVQVEVIEAGDGETVEPGDSVTVNYTGVAWSDGEVFDSSWERGETATFATNQVVAGFQRALEGQTVGSTVLVSMAPACGYGEAGSGHELSGETLVFVVEIIETTRS